MEPGGKELPSRGKLGVLIPLVPGSYWARGVETVKDRISDPQGAIRDRKADFGPALSDQDSRARKCEELRCWVPPGNLEAGLGKEGQAGYLEADRRQLRVSELLPGSSFPFISSCFQAMKFFPGEIGGPPAPPAPPGVCHVYGGFRRTEAGGAWKGVG